MNSSSLKLLIIILMEALSFFYSSSARNLNRDSATTYEEFIRTSCSVTSYPKLCLSSLASHASLIQASPKLLAHAALNVTLSATKSTSTSMLELSQNQGMKPREVSAMHDCVEEISDAIDELRKSIGEMGKITSSNFVMLISDVQTWVSAALTDETTCSDGFAGPAMNGNLKTVVRKKIVNISHLTSNALALVNSYAGSLHG